MRITVTIEDELLARAADLTGISDHSALISEGLRALTAHESALRLAAMGGTDPDAWVPGRRRFDPE